MKKLYALCLSFLLVLGLATNVFAIDEEEPNNNRYEAEYFFYQETYNGYLSEGDIDFYKFKCYDSGYFTITLTPSAGKKGVIIVYREGIEKNIAYSPDVHNPVITFPVTRGYTYQFSVSGEIGSYQLDGNIENTEAAAYENNNTADDAFNVNLDNGNIIAAISASDDIDFYKYTPRTTETANIHLIGPSDTNYDICIQDSAGAEYCGKSNDSNEDVTCNFVAGRTYIIIVWGNHTYSEIPYSIHKS